MIIGVSDRIRARAKRINEESTQLYNIAGVAATIETTRQRLEEMGFASTGPEISGLDKVLSLLDGWSQD